MVSGPGEQSKRKQSTEKNSLFKNKKSLKKWSALRLQEGNVHRVLLLSIVISIPFSNLGQGKLMQICG